MGSVSPVRKDQGELETGEPGGPAVWRAVAQAAVAVAADHRRAGPDSGRAGSARDCAGGGWAVGWDAEARVQPRLHQDSGPSGRGAQALTGEGTRGRRCAAGKPGGRRLGSPVLFPAGRPGSGLG